MSFSAGKSPQDTMILTDYQTQLKFDNQESKLQATHTLFGNPQVLIQHKKQPEQDEYKELLKDEGEKEIKKYLERIKKEKEEENEYNRASITEYQVNVHQDKKKIGPNEGNVLRVLNKNDTSSKSSAYINKAKTQNQKRL